MKKLGLLLLLILLPLSASTAQDASVPAEGIAWQPFEKAVELAERTDKKLLVDVYAPWCQWCRRLQREVYTDPAIQKYVAETFVMTRLDGDDTETRYRFKNYDLTSNELAVGLGAEGFPTTVFLAADSDYITRVPGFVGPEEFLTILRYIGSEAYAELTFEEFLDQQE